VSIGIRPRIIWASSGASDRQGRLGQAERRGDLSQVCGTCRIRPPRPICVPPWAEPLAEVQAKAIYVALGTPPLRHEILGALRGSGCGTVGAHGSWVDTAGPNGTTTATPASIQLRVSSHRQ